MDRWLMVLSLAMWLALPSPARAAPFVYVAPGISMIDTATNTAVAAIPVTTSNPATCNGGIAITPNGAFVYVAVSDPSGASVYTRKVQVSRSSWPIIGRPYSTAGGKIVHARVQRIDQPASAEVRSWDAFTRISVRRA